MEKNFYELADDLDLAVKELNKAYRHLTLRRKTRKELDDDNRDRTESNG
jgi:hypothetical protein